MSTYVLMSRKKIAMGRLFEYASLIKMAGNNFSPMSDLLGLALEVVGVPMLTELVKRGACYKIYK